MRAGLAGLLAVPLLLAPAAAQTISDVRVTWYGAFTVGKARKVTEPGGNGVEVQTSAVHPPMVNSERVAFAPDTNFGFGYALIGQPMDARIRLRYVIKLPPPGAIDARTGQTKLTDEGTYPNLRIGRGDLFLGESLAQFRDPPAGTWTMQLWYEDRMLLEKSFTLAK